MSVTCGRSVVLSGYSSFLQQENWPPWYSWNIVESGVKHHKPKPITKVLFLDSFQWNFETLLHIWWKSRVYFIEITLLLLFIEFYTFIHKVLPLIKFCPLLVQKLFPLIKFCPLLVQKLFPLIIFCSLLVQKLFPLIKFYPIFRH